MKERLGNSHNEILNAIRLAVKSGFQMFIVGPKVPVKSALLQLFVNQICRGRTRENQMANSPYDKHGRTPAAPSYTASAPGLGSRNATDNHRSIEARWKDLGTQNNLSALNSIVCW